MEFKRFKSITIFYILLIIVLSIVATYVYLNTYFWLTSIWILIAVLVLAYVFLLFIGKEYRKLSHFLNSVEQDDFNPPYHKSFKDLDLNSAFQKLSGIISSLRDNAQASTHYLQSIINHVNHAIICLDNEDKIVLVNKEAKKIFNKNVLRDLNSLQISNIDLPFILSNLRLGEKKVIKVMNDNKLYNYSLQLANFKIQKINYRLFSFQNIQSELEQNELESWQKLTRVITHEIMNSAIPISNLSGLVYNQLFDETGNINEDFNEDAKSDIQEGLLTIENRSKGLVNFVEATRNFTKMPNPDYQEISLEELINRVVLLLKSKISELKINVNISVENKDLKIHADKSMIEQIIINLLLNAFDALKDIKSPLINIDINRNENNRVTILIQDNGCGISIDDLENIFIPFYTTKKNGSGVGLSLTKQIMYLHKGSISVDSKIQEGTRVCLTF